eukprot:2262524-Rhodomonas_salina.1
MTAVTVARGSEAAAARRAPSQLALSRRTERQWTAWRLLAWASSAASRRVAQSSRRRSAERQASSAESASVASTSTATTSSSIFSTSSAADTSYLSVLSRLVDPSPLASSSMRRSVPSTPERTPKST